MHFRSVIEELHRKSLESEEFGRKAARAFGNVSQLEVSGVKLRDVVLRNIQTDFKSESNANQTALDNGEKTCDSPRLQ